MAVGQSVQVHVRGSHHGIGHVLINADWVATHEVSQVFEKRSLGVNRAHGSGLELNHEWLERSDNVSGQSGVLNVLLAFFDTEGKALDLTDGVIERASDVVEAFHKVLPGKDTRLELFGCLVGLVHDALDGFDHWLHDVDVLEHDLGFEVGRVGSIPVDSRLDKGGVMLSGEGDEVFEVLDDFGESGEVH